MKVKDALAKETFGKEVQWNLLTITGRKIEDILEEDCKIIHSFDNNSYFYDSEGCLIACTMSE